MNLILGGGVVALFAKDILSEWCIIPIAKSVYYSHHPPISDDYIIRDDSTDHYLASVLNTNRPVMMRSGFSYKGILSQDAALIDAWLLKKYGQFVPPQAKACMKGHMDCFAHCGVVGAYNKLKSRHHDVILSNNDKYGKLLSIDLDNHIVKCSGGSIEWERMINTIPLDAFFRLAGVGRRLESKDMWCYRVLTNSIDPEGFKNIYIVDDEIDFYQATNAGDDKVEYVFYSTNRIERPANLFMKFLSNFDLVDETVVKNAIACGSIPQIEKSWGIINLGSGVWDDFLDIGSSIKRLLKMG